MPSNCAGASGATVANYDTTGVIVEWDAEDGFAMNQILRDQTRPHLETLLTAHYGWPLELRGYKADEVEDTSSET